MDIKSLQLFQHLATSLHFAQTAEASFVSPSTLSRVIQRLEQECECELFVRDKRSVKLTPEGIKFQQFCQETTRNWLQLKQEFVHDSHLLKGEITLYCSVTASFSHLPKLLNAFRLAHPLVEFKLNTGDPAKAAFQVKQQLSDVAIAVMTEDFPTDLTFKPIGQEPLVLIAPKDAMIQSIDTLDWQEHSVILPASNLTQGVLNNWFAKKSIQPNVYATVSGNEAIVSMVSLGCGVGIVPKAVLDNTKLKENVQSFTIPDIPAYQLGLCCLKRRETEPLVAALMAH